MTKDVDLYWDELGITWCAIDYDVDIIAPRLEARLRRQSRLIATGIFVGILVCAAGLLLAAFTVWGGLISGAWHFVTRGIAICAISAMLAYAILLLLPVRAADATKALPEMIDLAMERARRTLAVIRWGFYACAIAAVFGLVGTAIRVHFAGPPRMSPFVDLAILTLVAWLLFLFRRHTRRDLEKFAALRRALAVDGEG